MSTKHYAEFLYPGAFVSETAEREIASREQVSLPARAYGYRLFSRTSTVVGGETLLGEKRDFSPWHYKGEVWTLEQVRAEHRATGAYEILLSNMEINGWSRVLRCAQGTIDIDDSAVVLGKEKVK